MRLLVGVCGGCNLGVRRVSCHHTIWVKTPTAITDERMRGMAPAGSPEPASGSGARAGPRGAVSRRGLFGALEGAGPGSVTLVSAAAGSGKTQLVRAWCEGSALAERTAWVSVERGERDPQRFWASVVGQLRIAVGDDVEIENLTPAPAFKGEAVVERLASDLALLVEPVVLVIDDLHELAAADALGQLELLIQRRPSRLRLVLITRRDPRLGLHRLRLAGQLNEVRDADLRFTPEQTRVLLDSVGVRLADEDLAVLHRRTEGWVAGLRLAAISLTGHPDAHRFVMEFSGSERTVGDYLLAEVLDSQPEEVRQMLLCTSVLDRVSAPLADLLVGHPGSERILLALEEANAFVVSIDAARTWFRYHHLFADLLRLQLRRSAPDEVATLHRTAAGWFAENGCLVDAIRHAQAAGDWSQAAGLLADHAFSLLLDGQEATVGALLSGFPTEVVARDAELAVVVAADRLNRASLDEAAAHISVAERNAPGVPDERRRRFDVALAVVRLSLARRRGDLTFVLGEVRSLLTPAQAETSTEVALGQDLRAVALMNLGIVELWALQFEEAERHLQAAGELARRIDRPYVEVGCLAHHALAVNARSFPLAREKCEAAIALAEAHGWGADPVVALAMVTLGGSMVWTGRFAEAELWLGRAELALRDALEPATGLLFHLASGMLHSVRGELEPAIDAFRAAQRMQVMLLSRHGMTVQVRSLLLQTQIRLGQLDEVRESLASDNEQDRFWGESRLALAAMRLADDDPQGAVEALAPALDGSLPVIYVFSVVHALLFEADARARLGEGRAAEAAVERALELAEPDGLIGPFAMTPILDLLEGHPRHRTAHGALLSEILDILAGAPARRRADGLPAPEALSDGELRVLRFLPSNLSAPEIAAELYISVNTVKTHMRHIYAKLDAHTRTEAVQRARELAVLSPSVRAR